MLEYVGLQSTKSRVDRMPATEMIDSGSNCSRVKLKDLKIGVQGWLFEVPHQKREAKPPLCAVETRAGGSQLDSNTAKVFPRQGNWANTTQIFRL